jgi:lipopolysaccharide biosynthesis regulator YciM
MGVDCRRNYFQPFIQSSQNNLHSKKENQLNWVSSISGCFDARWLSLLLLVSIGSVAQISKDNAQQEIRESSVPAISVTIAPNPPPYAVSVAQLSVPVKAVKHLESAQKRFSKMDLQGAKAEIGRALEIDPNCAPAFSMRSFVRLAGNDSSGAIEDAVRAVALDSHEAESYVALATAYNNAKEFPKAVEAARHAVSIKPNAWQGRLELAKSLYGQGQYVLALSALNLVNKNFPDVHLVRADLLMRLDRTQEAADEFSLFMKQAPNDPRTEQVRQIVATAQQTATANPSRE